MMKRLTWFAAGAAAGAAGSSYAARKVRRTAQTLAPSNLARATLHRLRTRGEVVADAVREGRQAMRAKEAELQARRDGHAVVAVEPGQVIVLRDVRAATPGEEGRSAGGSGRRRRRI
jgi:hypothetical protein